MFRVLWSGNVSFLGLMITITYVTDKSQNSPHNFFFTVLVCAVCFHFMRSVVLCSYHSWHTITFVPQKLVFSTPLRVGTNQISQVKMNLTHKTELKSTSFNTTQNNQSRIPVNDNNCNIRVATAVTKQETPSIYRTN